MAGVTTSNLGKAGFPSQYGNKVGNILYWKEYLKIKCNQHNLIKRWGNLSLMITFF